MLRGDDLDRPLRRRAEAAVVADGDTGAAGEAPPVGAEEAPVGVVHKDDAGAGARRDGAPHDGLDLPLVPVALRGRAAAARGWSGPLGSGAPRYRP